VILTVFKHAGDTPLQALDALRAARPELAAEPMVYAGRLDPMAEGVLLVLTGDDRHALPEHLDHDKDYVARFCFGVRSDTYDALGRLTGGCPTDVASCAAWVATLAGTHTLPLPAWSAYKVRGKPLHAWAAAGRLAEIEVPRRGMEVRSARVLDAGVAEAAAVAAEVAVRVAKVRGTFRQGEVLADWAALAERGGARVWVEVALTVDAGVYVRALAEAAGQALGCGALLLTLRRTRVGPYQG
jgi:tRNA pseudouridine55 synthase